MLKLNLRSIVAALALAALVSPSAYAGMVYKSFTVTNNGNAPLNISSPAISGNVAEYSFVWNNCTAPVPVGGTCQLWAAFSPVAGGARPPASLDFMSDGSTGPNHSIALSGTGAVIPPANCNTLLASAPGTPSGYYTIQPARVVGGAQYSAYCDMTTDGGGWTRVNASLVATSSRTFGANDVVSGNNAPGASCAAGLSNWTVTTPRIAYNNIRLEFTRTTTVMQCSSIQSGASAVLSGMNGEYWTGAGWAAPRSTCTWSDNVWAYGDSYTRDLPKTWRLKSGRSADGTIKLVTACNYGDDSGAFTATMWLR
jgi:hypothetical protein